MLNIHVLQKVKKKRKKRYGKNCIVKQMNLTMAFVSLSKKEIAD